MTTEKNDLVHQTVLRFAELLRCAHDVVEACAQHDAYDSLRDDWAQASWERLVEMIVMPPGSAGLEIYGNGADADTDNSRVFYPERLPTHRVVFRPASGDCLYDHLNKEEVAPGEKGLALDRFVTMEEGWYYEKKPFDHVLAIIGDQEAVFKTEDVVFTLAEIPRDETRG